jgi:hypothetical protein
MGGKIAEIFLEAGRLPIVARRRSVKNSGERGHPSVLAKNVHKFQ